MDRRISTAEAERLISGFIPMFEYLNSHHVPYCVVGGLGVMLHAYCSGEEAFVNTSFIGATSELDGVDTPNFDVVRLLNARRLSDLDMTVLTVDGIAIKVATVDQLERMQRDTIGILKVGYADSPRPQDFEDLAQLERIRQRGRGRR